MLKNELPRSQDEFFSNETVDGYCSTKSFAMHNMEAQGVIDTLKEIGQLKGGEKLGTLVDVGCGYGIATSIMANHFDHAIGIDLSANQIKKARDTGHFEHVEFRVGNGEDMPVADESADVITCLLSVQHFVLDKFLRECRRVLKEGGVAIFYTYFMSSSTSLENDKLPPIVDEIKEMRESCLAFMKAKSHPVRFLWDDFQALYGLIDWPGKRRIQRKAVTMTKLALTRKGILSIPSFASMGTAADNPVIKAFQKIDRIWKLNGADAKVRVSWDTAIIVLKK